jgi:hypothetical protein
MLMRKMATRFDFAVTFCVAAMSTPISTASASQDHPSVTVCDLRAQPDKYNGLEVSVSGVVPDSTKDLVAIFDQSCPRTPVALETLKHPLHSSRFRELQKLIMEGLIERGQYPPILLTLRGVFEVHTSDFPRYRLSVRSIDRLK